MLKVSVNLKFQDIKKETLRNMMLSGANNQIQMNIKNNYQIQNTNPSIRMNRGLPIDMTLNN